MHFVFVLSALVVRYAPVVSIGITLSVTGVAKIALAFGHLAVKPILPVPLLVLFGVIEVGLGTLALLRPRPVVLWAVAIMGLIMLSGTLVLVLAGLDAARCGCFGAYRMSVGAHVGVAFGLVLLPILVLWREQQRVSVVSRGNALR